MHAGRVMLVLRVYVQSIAPTNKRTAKGLAWTLAPIEPTAELAETPASQERFAAKRSAP